MYANSRSSFMRVAIAYEHANCRDCHFDKEKEYSASFNQRFHDRIGFRSNPTPNVIHRGDSVIPGHHQDNQDT